MNDDPRYLLLANAAAGSADEETVGAALVGLAGHGTVRLIWTEHVPEVPAAIVRYPDAVPVLLGGDGTISSGVDALVSAGLGDRPIGVIPSGTGNDFARAVGIPLDAREAASALVDGIPRRFSTLSVTIPPSSDASTDSEAATRSRSGINALHLGIGAAASRRATDWKRHLGPAAYPLAAVLTGSTAQATHATLTNGDEIVFDGPTAMVAIVLGRSIGGGVELSEPSLTEDRADVLIARGAGFSDRLALAGALLSSDPGSRAGVSTLDAHHLVVHCDPPVPVNLDGEDLGDQSHLEVEVRPRSWTLLCPGQPRP